MKLKGLTNDEQNALIQEETIFLGYRGSIAHGMYIPNTDPNSIDDKDVMGVFLAKPDHYIGLKKEKETREKWHNEWDSVNYELKKVLSLLLKSNPNVLSLLWLNEIYILKTSDYWNQIMEIRDSFVSKYAYHSFSGYAHGQFKRMTNFSFNGYMGEKRKKLVEKYGYDCKNAAHLIRLLKMGIEFLNEGELYVERVSDAKQLIEIKTGQWTLEQVKKESERLFILCEESYVRSKLPDKPDYKKVNNVCKNILSDYLKE